MGLALMAHNLINVFLPFTGINGGSYLPWFITEQLAQVHHNLASLSAGMTCAFEYQVQGHDGYSTVGYLDELSHNSMLLYLEEVKACLVWSELQLMLLRKFWRVDIL
ncbi:uncharacterized protein [Spinacia oleracea]|uniref:Uncharacterized protein isoform X2 n=1 Tax=Spinacia oleracea TaxID=3562 RepID=A0ABM3R371_SPIOL|nr:uncharacterized protein LOC130465002 isoform X2 [Spinacia oleracea]